MKRIIAVVLPMLLLGCIFGTKKLTDYSQTLATVDGRAITVAEIDSVAGLITKDSGVEQDTSEIKEAALDSMIMQRLIDIRIDSVSRELDKDWEFVRKRERNAGETAKKILYQEKIITRSLVDSAQIAGYYEEHKDDFKTPEQVWARHILIRRPDPDTAGVVSEKEKQKKIDESDRFAKDRAAAVLKKALAGSNWDSLAATYSEDKQNSDKGGDLGYFYRGRMVPEFDSVAFSTPPGEIVGPVSTKFGYHIIKIEDYKPTAEKPLDADVKSQIRGIMSRENEKKIAMAYLDSLKENGTYELNDEILKSDDTSFTATDWVMIANGTDTLFYDSYAEALPRFKKWKQVDSLTYDNKLEMLDFMKTNLLLMNAARADGYLDRPMVVKEENDYTKREARQAVGNMMRDLEYEPTDAEIESYYYDHIDDYKVERKLKVYHIIFEDSTFAETIRDSIMLGADFVEMAKRYYPGEPEIREVAYNLDYIGPKDMGEAFYDAANALEINGVSHPVKTKWGYHLIKLLQRKEDRTLAQVRPGIKHTLKELRDAEKKRKIIEEWKSLATIDINTKMLNRYEPILAGSRN